MISMQLTSWVVGEGPPSPSPAGMLGDAVGAEKGTQLTHEAPLAPPAADWGTAPVCVKHNQRSSSLGFSKRKLTLTLAAGMLAVR